MFVTSRNAILAAGVCAAAIAFAVPADAGALVAPVYAGAQHISDTGFSALYFTKDASPKVRGFYGSHGLKLSNAGALRPVPRALSALPPKNDGSLGADLKSYKQICNEVAGVYGHTPHSMVDGPETAGVVIAWRTPPKRVDLTPDKDSVFSGFMNEVNFQRHSRAQYTALFKQYGWLETAYYPKHGHERYDHWLVNRTWAKLQAPQQAGAAGAEAEAGNMQAMAQRMQMLARQGKMQQAQALAMKMQTAQQAGMASASKIGAAQNKDDWNLWLGVLKKVEAHAYRTAIAVDKTPPSWPLLPYCPNLGK